MILTGTWVGKVPSDSRAFIGIDAKVPQTYSLGAALVNGARLVSISADHVVLELNGQREVLYLQQVRSRSRSEAGEKVLTVGAGIHVAAATSSNTEMYTEFIRPNPLYEAGVLVGYEVYAGAKSGIFHRLGLQAGDVITAIDGLAVTDERSAMEQFQNLASGGRVNATVRRKGKQERLSLDGSIVSEEQERMKNSGAAPTT